MKEPVLLEYKILAYLYDRYGEKWIVLNEMLIENFPEETLQVWQHINTAFTFLDNRGFILSANHTARELGSNRIGNLTNVSESFHKVTLHSYREHKKDEIAAKITGLGMEYLENKRRSDWQDELMKKQDAAAQLMNSKNSEMIDSSIKTNSSVVNLNDKTDGFYVIQRNTGYAIGFFTLVTTLFSVLTFVRECNKANKENLPTKLELYIKIDSSLSVEMSKDSAGLTLKKKVPVDSMKASANPKP